MQLRFSRDFELTVTTDAGAFVYVPPFRLQFSALKSAYGGLNKLTCKLFGLSEQKRLSLVKDAEEQKRITLELKIGYQGRLERIFIGNVFRGENRLGSAFETILETNDGGFDYIHAYTSKTVFGRDAAIRAIVDDMEQTNIGIISAGSNLIRPKVLVGSSSKLLQELKKPDEDFFINDNKVNILKKSDIIDSYIPFVSPRTGLLTVPSREQKRVTFDVLFNPFVRIGGLVQLESELAPHINGRYKMESVSYDGDSEGDDWKQTCNGYLR